MTAIRQDRWMGLTRVLVVDDEPMVREVLQRYLELEGFEVAVAEDGEAALASFTQSRPDLVVLDLMLPRIDGLEVLRRMRVDASTARDHAHRPGRGDRPGGGVGARRGRLRHEAVLPARGDRPRARGPAAHGPERDDGRACSHSATCRSTAAAAPCSSGGRDVHLTRKEFDLLEHLATLPGMTFTRQALLEAVWDFAWDGDTATVTVHIRRLREKIEADPSDPRHLVTVWGVGYRFEP